MRFDTTRGVAIHKSKNKCDISGTAAVKPRRDQRANKIIEAKKRAIKVETQAKITLNNEFISHVEFFKYFGAQTASYGGDDEEVEARTLQALQAYGALKGIWSDRRLSLDIKTRLFKVHLPSYYRDLHRAIELASNIQHWNEIFDQNVDFIYLF